MESLKENLRKEIEEFRRCGHSFLNKEITVPEFKAKSGGMGAYAERGGETFMIRLKFPSGIVSLEGLELVYKYTQKYGIKKIHFTTRETIQLHGLSIDDVCDIMEDCLDNEIYTRGGGGNFPRNVSLSPLSGVSKDEVFDPTPYASLVNKYFLERMTSYHLPRKLKVAFSNSEADTACATATDLGFIAYEKDGKPYFRMFLGGGLGSNPELGIEYDELINPSDVLYYVAAMVEFFKAEGNYDNKAKARVRYILKRMGPQEFIRIYKEFYKKVRSSEKLAEIEAPLLNKNPEKSWSYDSLLIPQKTDGLYTLDIHPECGHLKTEDLKDLITFIEKCSGISMRLSMTESILIRNLTKEKADELMKLSSPYRKTLNIEKSICCIGVPTCQMGIADVQSAFAEIMDYLVKNNSLNEYLPALNFSGCHNSCGRHQLGELGFAGKRTKYEGKIENAFDIFVGGELGHGNTILGTPYGIMLQRDIGHFLCDLSKELSDKKISFMQYLKDNKDDFDSIISKYLI